MAKKITLTVDPENHAPEFWEHVDALLDVLRALEHKGPGESARVSRDTWEKARKVLEHVPGWSDGPEHAPTPIVVR